MGSSQHKFDGLKFLGLTECTIANMLRYMIVDSISKNYPKEYNLFINRDTGEIVFGKILHTYPSRHIELLSVSDLIDSLNKSSPEISEKFRYDFETICDKIIEIRDKG